ncbi:hypothetical protein [Roseomonas sp. BN140053]|uniref:hypothetical protein n=1 Tax=Roseomonas sp. BN140053 TaxID=3391898 RepID=UPI0039EA50F3
MFRLLFLSLLVAQAAVSGVAGAGTPPAGDRLVSLVPRGAGGSEACTRDRRWCVVLTQPEEGGAVRPALRARGAAAPAPQPPAEDPDGGESQAVWPNLFVLGDCSFLAGVETRSSTGYSGGGGSATGLRLFRVAAGGTAAAVPVLEVPLAASLTIRACFGERDMRRRRGACHDEYGFSASLGLVPGSAAGEPVLRYATEAWNFPRGVSRAGDSTAMRPLQQADLVRQRDARCSITRQFRFDAAAGAFRPDRPLPDCSDYTVP